jgi:hypothetical protein
MSKRIRRIGVLQLGIVLAALYGCISLIVVPFLLIGAVASSGQGGVGLPIVFILAIPLLYALAGFLGGLLIAAIYNLIAGWTGGFEITLDDVPPDYARVQGIGAPGMAH